MKMVFLISLFLTSFSFADRLEQVQKSNDRIRSDLSDVKIRAALSMTEEESIKALIFLSMLDLKNEVFLEVPPEVQEKYATTARTFALTPVAAAAAIGSVKGTQYIWQNYITHLKLVQELIVYLKQAQTTVSKYATKSAKKFYLYQSAQLFWQGVKGPALSLKRLIAPLSNRPHLISYGSTFGSLYISSSLYFNFREVDNALEDHAYLRASLGYNNALMRVVNREVQRLSNVFQLSYEEEEKFKNALFDAIAAEIILEGFEQDRLNINLLSILKKSEVLTEKELQTLEAVESLYAVSTKVEHDDDDIANLSTRFYDLIALASLLDTIRNSEYSGLDQQQSERLVELITSISNCIALVLQFNEDQRLAERQAQDQ